MVSCQSGFAAMGFQADVVYRFPFRWFAIGMVGGLDFEPGGRRNVFIGKRLRGDGSRTCVADCRRNAILSASSEANRIMDCRRRWGGRHRLSDVAPDVGGGIGFDIPLGRHMLIGADVRELFFGFGKPPTLPPDTDRVQLTDTFWTTIGFLKIGAWFSL